MHARRLLLGTLVAAVGAQMACVAHANRGYTHYRNEAYGVAIDVPKGWTVSSHADGSMLTLHLKRPEPELHAEECTFFVTKSLATLRQSQAEINQDYRGDQNHISVRVLLMHIPDATASSETKIVEQQGRATVFIESTDGTGEAAFRSYEISFGVPGRSFDGSCTARPMHYAQSPIYEHILRSLSPIE